MFVRADLYANLRTLKNKKNEVLEMDFNYKMVGISLILLSTIVKVEGVLSPIEILERNQFRCGRQQSKELCSKSAIERKIKLKKVKGSAKIGKLKETKEKTIENGIIKERTIRIVDNGYGTVKTTIINKTIDQDGEVSTSKSESISKY